MRPDRPHARHGAEDAPVLQEARSLDRKSWRNWFLFVTVAVITTIGLATAILTLLGGRIATIWPWANTDLILLAGLSVAILLFAGYLTQQQRQVAGLRLELLKANQRSSEKVRQYYDRLAALVNVSRVLATSTDPQAVFDSITTTCLETFDCQQTSLMLLNDQTQELEVRSVKGHDQMARELATLQKVGQGIVGWVAERRKPFVLGRDTGALSSGSAAAQEAPLPAAAMVVPVSLRGELVGVLSVSSSKPGLIYSDDDLQALQVFAETAGICCRHAEQTDWMRQTIQRLDAALQERGMDESNWAA